MTCGINKIDSNITGLAFAEEECLKVLPGVNGADAVWYQLEPNSYSDFGGDSSTVARSPIDPSRQNKKGTITDLDASGGFNTDFTKSNLVRLLQGFFFADAHELATTEPLNSAKIVITGVTGTSKTVAAASGLNVFKAKQILFGSGFLNAANNGLHVVASSTAASVVFADAMADEAAPPAAAKLQAVGFEFPAGDVSFAVTSGLPSIVTTATDFTTVPGLMVGGWIFIGGDKASSAFAHNVGYARVKAISTHSVVFDDTTFDPQNETGAAISLRIFIGTILRNEKQASLIKRRSYNLLRTLGEGANSTQGEYLEGAVANEFTLNVPQGDKLNADLTFVACDDVFVSGDVGDELKPGRVVPPLGEDAFNTSSDIYRIKMSVVDPTSSNPKALFGYVSEANISINNNVTPNKAVGILGAFDTSAGNFEVGGSATVYFTTVAAVKAVRANADVALSVIGAARNAGFIFDIPLLGLGGGRIAVEKDSPITVPLEPAGAENANGYTLLFESFAYLPNLAMPD